MPPKKGAGEDTRGAKAKDQKSRAASERKAQEDALATAAEDREWAAGANSRAMKKKQEEEAKRAEAEARRALAVAQLLAEEAALGKGGKGLRGSERVAASKALSMDRITASFDSLAVESLEARSVDAAISMLSDAREGAGGPVERHPERRMKSAYAQFEEREMPVIKAENPGLRLSQLKNILQKQWKKSPDNPMNMEHVAFNAPVP